MNPVEVFERTVAALGQNAELAGQLMDQASFESGLKASVRADAETLGETFPLMRVVRTMAPQMEHGGMPVPMDTALFGLCALIFTSLVSSHAYFFAPDGQLWFRRR